MKDKQKKESFIEIIPLAFIVSIIPLIVYFKATSINSPDYNDWIESGISTDFFTYYRSLFLCLSAIACIVFLVIKRFSTNIKFKKTYLYIPIGIFSLFVLLSILFSNYNNISLFGYMKHFEGGFVILSYILIFIYTINITDSTKKRKIILYSLFASATLICIIGSFQYFGHEFYNTEFAKKLIIPPSYRQALSSLSINNDVGRIRGSMSNSNYFGCYMSMILPLSLVLLIFSKNKTEKILLGILSFLFLFNLVGSLSKSSFLGVVISSILVIILLRKYILKHWKIVCSCLASAIILIILFNFASHNSIYNGINSMYSNLQVSLSNTNTFNPVKLKDISINGNEIKIVTANETLKVLFANNDLKFLDDKNQSVKPTISKDYKEITFKDSRYKNYTFGLSLNSKSKAYPYVLDADIYGMKAMFILSGSGFDYANSNLVPYTNSKVPVKKWGFEGEEYKASGRYYIWSRSIPLLKDTIFIGHGPDTFPLYFPQQDFFGKMLAYNNDRDFIDKPHCFYLQTAINTGVISLIALLVLFIMYIGSCLKLYFNGIFDNESKYYGLAIFGATLSYLITMIFNDSVVAVAPIFWILLGIGININLSLRKNKQN